MSHSKPLFAFFGAPRFATVVLDSLLRHGYLPALIVSGVDKPQGRGLALSPTPAKEWAIQHGVDVETPPSLENSSFLLELANTPWDVFVVAAYGSRIPESFLILPKRGVLNIHPSLLPKLRGPSPVRSAILQDESTTGVSIMLIDNRIDHGPIVAQGRVELDEKDWPPQGSVLEDLLATEGGNLLSEILVPWVEGKITPEPQDDNNATHCKKFTDEDALISLSGDARRQFLKIRAFDRNPRAHFFARFPSGKVLRVLITDATLSNNVLQILKVIPEGKREMSYEIFLRSGATLIS